MSGNREEILQDVIAECAKQRDSFYLYNESDILNNVEALKTNFPQADFLYSIKCNSDPHVLRCIFQQGFGADAASRGEVRLARKAGLSPDRIYYSAPGKSREDLEETISEAVLIADSIEEIKRIQEAAERRALTVKIGIRINPDFSFAGEGGISSKFGIDEDQVLGFLKTNPWGNIKITGIHVHLQCQELKDAVLSAYYERMFRLGEKIAQICGPLEFINMGSGMGIPYAPEDRPLDISALGTAFQKSLDKFRGVYPNTKIFIETGRYVVCKNGIYVTKVMDRKESYGKTYLILKNTLNGFLRPSMAKLVARYAAETNPAGAEPLFTAVNGFEFHTLKTDEPAERVSLVGNLCTSADVIGEDILMPHLEQGDIVFITNAGSYGAVLSPYQFSSQERPAELFLTRSGEVIG